jgi:hypothetical protein
LRRKYNGLKPNLVIAGDTVINGFFKVFRAEVLMGNLSGYTAFSNNLTDFICWLPVLWILTYGGKSMSDAQNPSTNSRIKLIKGGSNRTISMNS